MKKRYFFFGVGLGLVLLLAAAVGAVSERYFSFSFLDRFFPQGLPGITEHRILTEESVVIDVAQRVSPSVVTIGITKTQQVLDFDLFADPFGFFRSPTGREETIEQDIATGFIIDPEGLIVTNKHVVADIQATYRVITNDDQEHEVEKIYRDPVNDLAILKINPATSSGLKPVELGDSNNLRVGQFVIAIGTALGEFRHTVTTGVVSGLGRGITAGTGFTGSVEELDNVIQTDAAINPGNSGGPLLNSAGQVIGVNVAVSAAGENIGFALPIDIVKQSLDTFNQTGKFERPYLGVRYRMISMDLALLNEVPQGAYIVEVVAGSPADKAGVKPGDIITKFAGQSVKDEEGGFNKLIQSQKVGDRISLTIWRSGEELNLTTTLEEYSG